MSKLCWNKNTPCRTCGYQMLKSGIYNRSRWENESIFNSSDFQSIFDPNQLWGQSGPDGIINGIGRNTKICFFFKYITEFTCFKADLPCHVHCIARWQAFDPPLREISEGSIRIRMLKSSIFLEFAASASTTGNFTSTQVLLIVAASERDNWMK